MADLKDKKHLFFDFDDTLWDFQKNSSLILFELFHEFQLSEKLKTDFNTFEKKYRSINLELWSKYAKRQIDKTHMRSNRFDVVFKFFGYDNYEENLRVTEQYLTRGPRGTFLKEGCIDTLEYLKQKHHLHIITNGFKESQTVKIEASGLKNYFTHIIISEEHQLVKPEEKIFRLAETLAGTEREHCIMIGDSFESDVTGALNAGWQAIYFTENETENYTGRTINRLAELKNLF
jgi:putative hydrolase of the HAD superfamily